jgi:hypothetical protein
MRIERAAPRASLTEVLDRVLDRGIVIDAWLRVSVAGIALIGVDARIVVASISTYVEDAPAVQEAAALARAVFSAPGEAEATAPEPRPAPRRVRLQCASACTFLRPASRRPASVRCPSDRRRTCPVIAVPDPA